MQGLQSLNEFKNFVSKIGGLGRYEDTYIVHAAEGETVVPMEVLDRNPLLKKRLFKTMMDMGIEPGRYIVGNELNSKNPVTGQPEFFLKKIVDRLKKAAGDISGYAAPIVGAMYGAPAGAAVGAGLGAFKRENPGDPNQALQMALRGGAAGAAANYLGGEKGLGILTGGGIQGAGGLGQFLFGKEGMYMPSPKGGMEFIPGSKGLVGSAGEFGLSGSRAGDLFTKSFGKLTEKQLDDDIKTGKLTIGDLVKMGIPIAMAIKLFGDAIGPAEDIRIASSMIDSTPRTDASFANITGPVTRDTSYASAGTPYLAAEGGIIQNYDRGGLTGNPHKERPDRIPLTDELKDQMYDFLLNFMMKKQIEEDEENRMRLPKFNPNEAIEVADGGIMDLRDGGASNGPGTGTSDSIPAMLSDGEFVMTAKAVRGAGGGDRREGAKKMYEAMDRLEARA